MTKATGSKMTDWRKRVDGILDNIEFLRGVPVDLPREKKIEIKSLISKELKRERIKESRRWNKTFVALEKDLQNRAKEKIEEAKQEESEKMGKVLRMKEEEWPNWEEHPYAQMPKESVGFNRAVKKLNQAIDDYLKEKEEKC